MISPFICSNRKEDSIFLKPKSDLITSVKFWFSSFCSISGLIMKILFDILIRKSNLSIFSWFVIIYTLNYLIFQENILKCMQISKCYPDFFSFNMYIIYSIQIMSWFVFSMIYISIFQLHNLNLNLFIRQSITKWVKIKMKKVLKTYCILSHLINIWSSNQI